MNHSGFPLESLEFSRKPESCSSWSIQNKTFRSHRMSEHARRRWISYQSQMASSLSVGVGESEPKIGSSSWREVSRTTSRGIEEKFTLIKV